MVSQTAVDLDALVFYTAFESKYSPRSAIADFQVNKKWILQELGQFQLNSFLIKNYSLFMFSSLHSMADSASIGLQESDLQPGQGPEHSPAKLSKT